jgi:hypothetical protein
MGSKYSTVIVAGFNSNPPADDGSQVASNQVKYSTTKTKLADPLKTAIEAVNSGLVTFTDFGSRQITSSDTSVASDHMKTIEIAPTASAAVVVSLGDAATMAAGYIVTVKNSSANSQTVGRITAGDKIDNVAQNITLPSKCSLTFKVANTASEGYHTLTQFGGFLYDKTDPRKVVVFNASGVSSGSVRTLTFQNEDGTLALTSEFVYSNLDGSDGRLQYPSMWIQGLVPSAPTNSTVALTVGSCRDVSDTANLILSSAITKAITATWVVGSGNGGLDTGAVTNSSWYYGHLIKRSDTGVVDALWSLSATAPTMPANYDKRRIVAAARTDSAGTFVAFDAYELAGGGLEVLWDSPTLDINLANTLTTSRRTDVVKVPTAFSTIANLNAVVNDTAATQSWIYCPDQSDLAPSGTAAPLFNMWTSNLAGPTPIKVRTSATGTVAARSNTATVDLYAVSTLGFEWARRN